MDIGGKQEQIVLHFRPVIYKWSLLSLEKDAGGHPAGGVKSRTLETAH